MKKQYKTVLTGKLKEGAFLKCKCGATKFEAYGKPYFPECSNMEFKKTKDEEMDTFNTQIGGVGDYGSITLVCKCGRKLGISYGSD
jgi:hypothetical protein